MNPNASDDRLAALLHAADRGAPPRPTAPIRLQTIQRRFRRRTARRQALLGLAAAIALFSVLSRPMLASAPPGARPSDVLEREIGMLEREAEAIERSARGRLVNGPRQRERTQPETDARAQLASTTAAAENAAFLLYCEADRLARDAQSRGAAYERFAAVAERFPGTVWARMASEMITTSAPIEKG